MEVEDMEVEDMEVEDMEDMAPVTAERAHSRRAEADLRWGSWLMGIAAAGFVGYAVIFFIQDFSPSLYEYIGHLHIAVSGFIAATGVAVLFLVAYGVRRGELWAWVGAVVAPVLGLAVALPAHYPNHFDTLGHLGLIYLATLIFVAGALLALRGIRAAQKT